MTEAPAPSPAEVPAPERTGRSILVGAALVVAYSVLAAIVRVPLHRAAVGPSPADPAGQDVQRLALAGWFVQDLLQGPVLWIVGSGILAFLLAGFGRSRSFRLVLAATGVPFLAPAVCLAAAWGVLSGGVRLPRGWGADRVVLVAVVAGMSGAGVWTVVRLTRLGVEAWRAALATVLAAGLFVLGKWLPSLLR